MSSKRVFPIDVAAIQRKRAIGNRKNTLPMPIEKITMLEDSTVSIRPQRLFDE